MNIVIWSRVSSREQKEGYSIDAQLRACREKALKNGWPVLREFQVVESAKRGAERTAFNEMLAWVKANAKRKEIGAILSHKLDRTCRNMPDAVRLQGLEDDCGVKLAFVENQFGPGAAGAFSFNVMAAMAQYYSDNLRSEVLKGMEERVLQGWPIGHAPFGYINVHDKAEPVQPTPEGSKALVRIFELFATGQHTFKTLEDKLAQEGFVYQPSQPRFHRMALSHILNNRFYIGELRRNGDVHAGKHRVLISRQTFDLCQDILNGRNRRTSENSHPFSGGLFQCGYCGAAMTGELIRRKLRGGGVREHLYYRCANNHRGADHPIVRWHDEDLGRAILEDFKTLRMPEDIAAWFRTTIRAAFADVDALQGEQKRSLTKRRTELANMRERLLNGYLAGAIEEAVFQAKDADLKRQIAGVEESLGQANRYDPEARVRALALFDFSQNLANIWHGSNTKVRREILDCISLNRTVSTATLCMTKRKPFDFLAEKGFSEDGRAGEI